MRRPGTGSRSGRTSKRARWSLSPSLAATVLKRKHGTVEESWLGTRAPGLARALERARVKFNDSFQGVIRWYVDHRPWWEKLVPPAAAMEREIGRL